MTAGLVAASVPAQQAADTTTVSFDWNALLDWQTLLPRLLETVLIIVIAMAGYRVLRALIRRMVERQVDDEDPLERRLRQQRAQTLGSLLSSVALVVIATVSLLTILNNFLDIGPLLASVGVLGLAVSFGAQSLVKDVITGTFMLLESQFAIGDVIRIGDVAGQVERITLRTTVLRDGHGIVHIIPNGEITRVSNMTKSWSRAVIDVGVGYGENVDRAIDVLRRTAAEFHADREWAPLLLDVPEVLGIEQLADSAVLLRISARTLPQQQWAVARELRRRIKNSLDREGIEIPFPHLTLYWGAGQKPGAPDETGRRLEPTT